jgi:hypothetical protein
MLSTSASQIAIVNRLLEVEKEKREKKRNSREIGWQGEKLEIVTKELLLLPNVRLIRLNSFWFDLVECQVFKGF